MTNSNPTNKPLIAAVSSKPASDSRASIDLYTALLSTLHAWLAARDAVLVLFCPSEDEGRFVPTFLTDLDPAVTHMNRLLESAKHVAEQMVDTTLSSSRRSREIETVLDRAIGDLLSTSAPRFSLAVDNIPGSF